MSNKTPS